LTTDRLSLRALNRATLDRQLLLERSDTPILEAVTHLVGLQAQVPLNPYLALWSRLAGFPPEALGQLLLDRAVVRIVVMRGTIHLVTADDCLVLRPLAQPVLDAELARHPEYGPPLVGVDLEPVLQFVRGLTAEQPRTGPQLRQALNQRFPDLDPGALAFACRNHLAFVQVPPRGVWGRSGPVTSTTAESWLGRPVERDPSVDAVILRYLGAFGPATPADATAWSRLTGLREVFDRLRPQLRALRDDRGRELFDLPDAPRPAPDVAAPPRFLPEYDNALLSHADRSRFGIGKTKGPRFAVERPIHGTVLVDGSVGGTWRLDHDAAAATATLCVDHVGPMTKRVASAVTAEGRRMVRFQLPDAKTRDVRFARLD
jgi:Winged helix DNA-binding domain